MSQKAIREYSGKRMLTEYFTAKYPGTYKFGNMVLIDPKTDVETLSSKHKFLTEEKLVAKPDQLIKRRGKLGLVKLKASWDEAKAWVNERRDKEFKVGT
mmetsp:Transcript_39040/g.65482  ORF Transcript_39040/g.65482 Transcript_39040/m.65482 type:complete len:99 (-) Transcript_39040:24-320(-)